MKIKTIFSTLLLGLIVTTTSCTKDNYDAPESTLMGRIVYKGEPLQLRGTSEAIQLQLYQDVNQEVHTVKRKYLQPKSITRYNAWKT